MICTSFYVIHCFYVWWDGSLPTSKGMVKDGAISRRMGCVYIYIYESKIQCVYIYIYIYIWLPKLKTSHVKFKVDSKNLKYRMVT